MMNALTILPAVEGGYLVIQDREAGLYNTPLHAGTLQQCLGFVEQKFTPAKASPDLNDDIPF